MADSYDSGSVRGMDRINLRLPPETFAEIDLARAARAGHVSRNTWLTEAVEEKLQRERASVAAAPTGEHRHG